MGSHNLRLEIRTGTREKFFKMFEAIRRSEKLEYGRDPYSGTWATIREVKIVADPYPSRRWTAKKKEEVFEWIEDNTEKWGPAYAVQAKGCFLVAGWAIS